MEKIHRFEQRGLGKAPFTFVDMIERRTEYGQPAGTCDYCSNGIAYCYIIRSSDGRKFQVGSDCVTKTGDEGLTRIVDIAKQDRKRALEIARWEAECAAQRLRNGGKTDQEIEGERREAERKAKAETDSKASEWLWSVLLNSGTNFGQNVGGNLRLGLETIQMLTPRCVDICKEIYAKTVGGRRGSKAYVKAEEEFEAKIVL